MKKTALPLGLLLLVSSSALAVPSADEPAYDTVKEVTETIVITKPGTYDYKGTLHVWKGKDWGCNENENGPQMLRIEASNVVVKNFFYVGDGKTHGSTGLGDPIHVATCGKGQGNLCTGTVHDVVLDHIYGHACEDLLTIGTPDTENVTVQNSVLKANPDSTMWDKTVQINFGRNIQFKNNRFVGGKRCIRFKPNTTGSVIGNVFDGCEQPVLATSLDADIKPMANGASSVVIKGNDTGGKRVFRCNDNRFAADGEYHCE